MQFEVGLSDVLFVSPLIVLFLFALLPITIKVLRGNVEQSPLATLIQALTGIGISAGLQIVFCSGSSSGGYSAFSRMLVLDGISMWVGLIALISTAGSLVLMYENPATKGRQFSELVFLTLSSATGMLLLTSAVDLLMIFIGLEMMSLPLYLMIAMSHEEKLAKEAAFKYFILGSFASAILLFGISFVFGSTGGTNILDWVEKASTLVQTNRLFLFGLCMIIVGFSFKVSVVPFHAWTPDVYQGAPTPITAFMATAVKAVSFGAILRIVATQSLLGSVNLFDFLQWLAVLTMLVGNVGAIVQNNLKRMLAYSSIAHSGYLMVGVIASGIGTNKEALAGTSGVIFYLFSYALMTLAAFALVSVLERSESHIANVDELSGLAKKRPFLSICFTIAMLSLAGVPPLLGFFSKFYLFNAAIGQGLLWLAIWGVLNSVISVYYYLRPIVTMYMKDGEGDVAEYPHQASLVTLALSAVLIASLGLISGPLFSGLELSLF